MKRQFFALVAAAGLSVAAPVSAQVMATNSADFGVADMYLVSLEGPEKYIGTIEIRATEYGVVFDPELSELSPGLHGFHVHERPDCGPGVTEAADEVVPAGEAENHYDPTATDRHGGPWDVGHRGDLPNLYVNDEGEALHPVLAPRMRMEYLLGRSLIIHAEPDNYTDDPFNGGSGERIACGTFSPRKVED
jgi:Cu-Zn family superoxide dismutase